MKHRDLWEIYRRWRAGQSLARIAAGERRERKTVRRYLREFGELGLDRDGPVVDRQRFYEMVTPLLAGSTRRAAPAAEHYGVFIDPCRVARSTDKGKVERFVPVARELFRRLAALHVDAPLRELNEHAVMTSNRRLTTGTRSSPTPFSPPSPWTTR